MIDSDDRTPTGQPTEDQQEPDRDATVTVAEAARLLGVSTDAIRSRLRRGTLEGVKDGGEWSVILPEDTPRQDATGTEQDGDRQPTGQETGSQQDALISQLQDNISDLRDRLDWAQSNIEAKDRQLADVLADLARQRERTDVLQAQYHQAVRQLEATTATTLGKEDESDSQGADRPQQESTGEGSSPGSTGFAGWIRRLFGGQ